MSGTRESIGRLVAAEHSRLESLFAETLGNLREGAEGTRVDDAFARLRDQLEAHLAREDHLYYPALRALRPAHREPLAAIAAAHDAFRSRLAQIEASLARGAPDSALRELESLASLFAAHEVAEERMLHQIDQEIRAEAIPSAG
jgi:hemerythrin HHE cation binding domain-containing protein